jgi:aflatoxin B1 aldehyde reductase
MLQLGVSNFAPSMLSEWLSIAEAEGYVKPSVYQGQYNLLCRGYEDSLFPLLHKHNMVFHAFSPLAHGFLLGGYTSDASDGGKAGLREFAAPNFRDWYDRPSMHEVRTTGRKVL